MKIEFKGNYGSTGMNLSGNSERPFNLMYEGEFEVEPPNALALLNFFNSLGLTGNDLVIFKHENKRVGSTDNGFRRVTSVELTFRMILPSNSIKSFLDTLKNLIPHEHSVNITQEPETQEEPETQD